MSFVESLYTQLRSVTNGVQAELFISLVKTLVAAQAIISPLFSGMWPTDYGQTSMLKGLLALFSAQTKF